jgi:hypothetical protein
MKRLARNLLINLNADLLALTLTLRHMAQATQPQGYRRERLEQDNPPAV